MLGPSRMTLTEIKFKTSRWKFYLTSATTTARHDKKLLQTFKEVNKILFQGLLDTIMIVTFYKIRIEFSKWLLENGKDVEEYERKIHKRL